MHLLNARRSCALFLVVGTSCFHPLASFGAPAAKPNILFIMSDDHAAHALSAYGSERILAMVGRS